MGERSVFRDVVFIVLFVLVAFELYVIIRQNDHDVAKRMEDISNDQKEQLVSLRGLKDAARDQNQSLQSILEQLKKGGVTIAPATSGNTNNNSTSVVAVAPSPQNGGGAETAAWEAPREEPGFLIEDWEKQYLDPNAEPGGTFYSAIQADPGTLNPLTENDATVSHIHNYISESLAFHDYRDYELFVPELATGWEKLQSSWGLVKGANGNAKELAAKLNSGFSADTKKWIKASAEADGRLRLDITHLGNAYLGEVEKVLGLDAFTPVQWIYAKPRPEAGEKDLPDIAQVMKRFQALLATKAGLALPGAQIWTGENGGLVFRIPGANDGATALVKDFIAQKEQQGPKGPVWEVEKSETFPFEDKLYFTFHLRSGVTWHDGTPLTVKDYLFSFNALKDPGVNCNAIRNYYMDCESLEAPDEHTLRFTWHKLYNNAFSTSASLPLLPEHIYKYKEPNELNNNPHNKEAFGTGPYRLKEWLPKQRIVLERNENYWDRKPNFKQLYVRVVAESASRYQMLKTKQLDEIGLTEPQWVNDTPNPPFGEPHGIVAVKQDALAYRYLGWNCLKPQLSDKRVRKALTMSINREKINDEILHKLASVVHGTFYAKGPYGDPELKPLPYDPVEAAKLFKEAGWTDHDGDGFLHKDGQKLEIKIRFPASSETGKKILIAVQSDLRKAGVACELDPIEWSVFLQKVKKRDFEAIYLGWALTLDPDPYQLFHSSQAVGDGSNHCSFINKEADEIMTQIRKTFDKEELKQLCHRIDRILQEEQPYTFLFEPMDLVAHNADLRNMYLPLRPGEKRDLYFPLSGSTTRRWYIPKQYQREEDAK